MPDCPCCSGTLLRHVSQGKLYWYCLDCRQEMPQLSGSLDLIHQHQPPVVSRPHAPLPTSDC